MSIKDTIKQYDRKDIYPFHMPGHKRNSRFLSLGNEPVFFDTTEIPGMDNLHEPEEMIAKSQQKCAALFGAEESYYLVNGSTGGIMAAILACTKSGGGLLAARNCHKSVYSGIVYAGIRPCYVCPEMTDYGVPGGVSPKKIDAALDRCPEISAVIITSPTYEGFVSPVARIADAVHRRGKILIVDEAHGAHFGFHQCFPRTALEMGADIAIQSFHKTLPAFTQSSVLHVQGTRVDRDLLKSHLSMLQSSSPSYLLLLGLDNCVELIGGQGASLFDAYAKKLSRFREQFHDNSRLRLLGGAHAPLGKEEFIEQFDIGKLVFHINNGFSAKECERILYEKFGIQLEMSSGRHFIAMTSIADTEEGFSRLSKAIAYGENEFYLNGPGNEAGRSPTAWPEAVYGMHPKEAMDAKKEKVLLKDAAGRVSCEFITPYPPGIPVVAPGEVIPKGLSEMLYNYHKNEIFVVAGA